MKSKTLPPTEAVSQLSALHASATSNLKAALDAYLKNRTVPSAEQRASWRYPELRVTYEANGLQPSIARAYAKFQGPGAYATTVTHPGHFSRYLIDQLSYLVKDYGATIEVLPSQQEIPYPYVLEKGDDLGAGGVSAAELALRYGADLIPFYATRRPDGLDFDIELEAPVPHSDPVTMTIQMNQSLEARVRAHPGQWFWIHRRWK